MTVVPRAPGDVSGRAPTLPWAMGRSGTRKGSAKAAAAAAESGKVAADVAPAASGTVAPEPVRKGSRERAPKEAPKEPLSVNESAKNTKSKSEGGSKRSKERPHKMDSDAELVADVRAYMKLHKLSQVTVGQEARISQAVISQWLSLKYHGHNDKVSPRTLYARTQSLGGLAA